LGFGAGVDHGIYAVGVDHGECLKESQGLIKLFGDFVYVAISNGETR
jgi:hypothetical protein